MDSKADKITKLIDRAAEATTGAEAMQFAQAACNAANAMCSLGQAVSILKKAEEAKS